MESLEKGLAILKGWNKLDLISKVNRTNLNLG